MVRRKPPKPVARKTAAAATSRRRPAPAAGEAAETPPDKNDPVLPAVNPAVDDHLTPQSSLPFPIVAIGASAGGLEAFNTLLKVLPVDTGMAFVVIQHLSPTHESMLTEILTRATKMPVAQVIDNMPVERDHVYVIPPGKNLVLGRGVLELAARTEVRGQQRPIDHFMRSLGEEHGHKAIGVVLSGTANDGSLGVQEIKAAGGITFAQDSSAEQQSMPRSAIATGAIDFVLPPEEIAKELGRISRHPYVSPALDSGSIALNESGMERIFGMLRKSSGVDFDGYKRSTITRRIARRMVLHKLDGLHDYVRFLQNNAPEVDALFQDLLINVTSFFRNPDAYEALKTVVFPKLTDARTRHEPVRIWALGCSTGEEAYSLAIAFTEYAEQVGRVVDAQIFATDLNGTGIDKARAGIYAKGITQDVSPERLRRFFVEIDGAYRINKKIRDMCVFARQNVLADPPFSRLDMVACRNLLIYLEPTQQARLVPMLHYALRNNGFLWLGGSETIGSYRDLFDVLDNKHKIYAKKVAANQGFIPAPGHRWEPHRGGAPRVSPPPRENDSAEAQREAERMLLARYAPPSVVVNDELAIVQFRGDTGPYLSPSPGRATLNLLKMLREGIVIGVRNALHRVRKEGAAVRVNHLRVRSNGGWRDVDVEVIPLKNRGTQDGGSYVIVFEEPAAAITARARQLHQQALAEAEKTVHGRGNDATSKEAERLGQELAATREYLQSVIEQQEAANEELQSANEEVQSANEELQSINEELETSKEEIQSANEELVTVNDELSNRNEELARSNNDLTNLFASVHLPILMLDEHLRIRRFTAAAEKQLNLIQADIGRPLTDVKLNLTVDSVEEMLREVIDEVVVREREVQDRTGRWFSLRARPYRTLENRIEGAVLVMVDIDEQKRIDHALRESEARFELLANTAPVLIWMTDLEGCRFVNRAFEDFVGEIETDIRGTSVSRFVHPDDRDTFENAYDEAIRSMHGFEVRTRVRRADGVYRWTKTTAQARYQAQKFVGLIGGTFDITDMKDAEAALLELDRGKNEFLAMLAHELRNPLSGVRNASRLLGDAGKESLIVQAREIIDRQTGHMVRLIDDLLDVSRITQGKIHLATERVDLTALIRSAVEAGALEREAQTQTLTLSLPDVAVWVDGDPMRLDQIVSNLVANASKFTRTNGRIWVTLEVDLDKADREPSAVLRVRDNGIGMDPNLLPRVFDLFVQADPGDRSRPGIGLGLTLARRLVDLHGGTIEAYSAGTGMGSEFTVRLPLAAPPAKTTAPAKAKKAREKEEAAERVAMNNHMRILIIDDNADSAQSMRMMLEIMGHEVEVGNDGVNATELALRFRPQAILLDIGLPDKDGYAIARELRQERELDDVVLVAVTGYGGEDDKRRTREAGFDEHMTKPVDPDRLVERIREGRSPQGATMS